MKRAARMLRQPRVTPARPCSGGCRHAGGQLGLQGGANLNHLLDLLCVPLGSQQRGAA